MFIGIDHDGITLALRDADGRDLLRKAAAVDGSRGMRLRPGREVILIDADDTLVSGDILARLWHGIDTVLRLHRRVDEAPADGRVRRLARINAV